MHDLKRYPEAPLDLLVVGAGPAGTAAAFRAKELGLNALTIEHDDIMKRIRDYAKDKLILPDFGRDASAFPEGGELISRLPFNPIDKDDLCRRWKELYAEFQVPVTVGVELLGIARTETLWRARVWDHGADREHELRARSIVLATGRGVPRRLDIPGNLTGIAFRLQDAAAFVGSPACVIGGGTSAAEAVIAISNAKVERGDKSPVYWSYRGESMPRVSRALAEPFFDACVGNGNVRYLPKSEPAAVLSRADAEDVLSVGTHRSAAADDANRCVHLEFPKTACLACIGEEVPHELLRGCGVEMVETGSAGKKRMVVSTQLETAGSCVFLAGDLLSQRYVVTDAYSETGEDLREVKHPGNIKSALRDGIAVAETIAARLRNGSTGKKRIRVPQTERPEASRKAPERVSSEQRQRTAYSLNISDEDGETVSCDISEGETLLLDSQLRRVAASAEETACIAATPDGIRLELEVRKSDAPVYVRVRRGLAVATGDRLHLGAQRIVVRQGAADDFEISHIDERGKERARYALGGRTRIFGRDAPDVSLDPADLTLSRRHAAVKLEAGKVIFRDLNSANGTWLRVKTRIRLQQGDQFRIGDRLATFGSSASEKASPAPVRQPIKATDMAEPAQVVRERPTANGATTALEVVFAAENRKIAFRKGQSLCRIAKENGIGIKAECMAGMCGSDPVRILEGIANVNPPDAEEVETLEDICELEPGPYRLACKVRPTGPLKVEVLITQ